MAKAKKAPGEPRRPRPYKAGKPDHIPTDKLRRQVESLVGLGMPHRDVCRIMGLGHSTLLKYYRAELDVGKAKANAQVAGFLFANAKKGNVAAQIFWLKVQAEWREPPKQFEHEHGVIRLDQLSKLSDEKLAALEEILESAGAVAADGGEDGEGGEEEGGQ